MKDTETVHTEGSPPVQEYYGTKRIRAVAMTRQGYNALRGWNVPEDENPNDLGYLVEYVDGGKPNVQGFDGYISWSPAEQFEKAYQPLTALSFGHAIAAMKEGHKVARAGWNGKGMFIAISPGAPQLPADRFWNPHNAEFARQNGGKADVLPCITMKTATGEILMGWLASQTDMLADDWQVVG